MFDTLFRFALSLTLLPLLSGSVAGGVFKLDSGDRFLMKHETLKAINYLQEYHYNRTPFKSIEAETLLNDFMESLDNHHLFFTKGDEEEIFARFATTLQSVYLEEGDLYPAFQIFEIYRDRALDRIGWVMSRLDESFDFTTDDTFSPDRSEADWPASADEADALWERRLAFELLQEVLNEEPLDRAKGKIRRRYERMERYVREIESMNVQEMFLANYAEMYDPHSTYYSADSMDEFAIAMENSLVGIGALLRDEDGYCVIQELIPGGPAEMSNRIHPGDKIVGVAQEGEEPVDVIDLKLRKVVKMIRGDKGTPVHLTVWPADASDPSERKVVTLVRDEVKLTEKLASADLYEVPTENGATTRIGVIELPSFYGGSGFGDESSSTTRDVEELIEKLKDLGAEGIVLDLRRNGGGLLSEAIDLTGLFIPRGPVVQVRDTIGRVRQDWDRDPRVAYDGPLVVLTSRHSASASEIVAGALQNHRRAVVVGDESTHGKGTVQAIFDFNRNNRFSDNEEFGAAKITIQKFYLPNGDSTQNKGVVADIALPSINMHLPIGESDLPNALSWDAIRPIEWNTRDSLPKSGIGVDKDLLAELRDRSEERLGSLEEFQYLHENIEWFRARQEKEEFSLNLKERKTLKEIDRAFKARMDELVDELSANRFASRPILLSLAQEKEDYHQEKLADSLLDEGEEIVNLYKQQTFYYKPEDGSPIKEIRVDSFDYEKAIRELDDVVAALQTFSEEPLDAGEVRDMLVELRGADRVSDYNMENLFEERFTGEISESDWDSAISAFFLELIEIDPNVAEDRPALDIHLRESLRILNDWVEIRGGSAAQIAEVAQKAEAEEPRPALRRASR